MADRLVISSYFLSSTLVPVLCVWILKHLKHEEGEGGFARFERRFERIVDELVRWRWVIVPSYLGACALVLGLIGTQLGTDGQLRLKLREGSGIRLDGFREKLRKTLMEQVPRYLAVKFQEAGMDADSAQALCAKVIIGFEPGDIVTEVMSFGSPTPIEVRVAGPKLPDVRQHALRVLAEFKTIPTLRDVQIQQTIDYPVVNVAIDREMAGLSGVTAQNVGDSVLTATSSSLYILLNYWQDPHDGVRLSGSGSGSNPSNDLVLSSRDPPGRAGQPGRQLDGPRCR